MLIKRIKSWWNIFNSSILVGERIRRQSFIVLVVVVWSYTNPSRFKDLYNLVRQTGELPPHINRYNFVSFWNFSTNLWGHLDKSITQVWVMKYFWNVTRYRWRHRWRQRRHILKHGYRFLVVAVLERWTFFCFLCFLGQESHSNYCQLRDLYVWPWNWRSRHGLRDFCYLCLYLSYRIEFFFVS